MKHRITLFVVLLALLVAPLAAFAQTAPPGGTPPPGGGSSGGNTPPAGTYSVVAVPFETAAQQVTYEYRTGDPNCPHTDVEANSTWGSVQSACVSSTGQWTYNVTPCIVPGGKHACDPRNLPVVVFLGNTYDTVDEYYAAGGLMGPWVVAHYLCTVLVEGPYKAWEANQVLTPPTIMGICSMFVLMLPTEACTVASWAGGYAATRESEATSFIERAAWTQLKVHYANFASVICVVAGRT